MRNRLSELEFPTLLDGGLSNLLVQSDIDGILWTAQAILNNPESIIQAHLAYLNAGARILATSSYQASFKGLHEAGLSDQEIKYTLLKSVSLAKEAIIRFKESSSVDYDPILAASIGPYGAYLADGSEYRGNYGLSDQELRDFHFDRIQLLSKCDVDCLAFETFPDLQEIKIVTELAEQTELPYWISFSCKDGESLNDGTPVKECVEWLKVQEYLFAVGINCTHPSFIESLIREIRLKWKGKIIVYPNSGEVYDAETKTWSGNPGFTSNEVRNWLDSGADIVGGCCRIGPAQIEEISRVVFK